MAKSTVKPLKHLLYFFKDLKQTGAIAPSSKFLAKDLVRQLEKEVKRDDCKPLKILEVGPGTGPLTKQIIKCLRPIDSLDIVEIHKKFYQIVKSRYRQPNLQIHHSDILQFQPDYKYDYIFSSLPYENMPEEISQDRKSTRLNSSHVAISYAVFCLKKKKNFKSDFEEDLVKKYGQNKKIVLRNLPPAKVYTLEINADGQKDTPLENINVA